MGVFLAALTGWFALTSVPTVATVSWRSGVRGEQVRVQMAPVVITTTVLYRGRRRQLNGGAFTTPWVHGTTRIELIQADEARTLDATLTIRFATLGYFRSYLPPPFTLTLVRR